MAFTIHVAATRSDWIDLFERACVKTPIQFYRSNVSTMQEIISYQIEDMPHLGESTKGCYIQDDRYLAIPSSMEVVPRQINMNNGTTRFAIDQLSNFDAFTFCPAGAWQSTHFIIGELNSKYNTGEAYGVAKKILGRIRRTFRNIGSCYVGVECEMLYSDRIFSTKA